MNLYQGCEKGCASFCIRYKYVHTETQMHVYACSYAHIHVCKHIFIDIYVIIMKEEEDVNLRRGFRRGFKKQRERWTLMAKHTHSTHL